MAVAVAVVAILAAAAVLIVVTANRRRATVGSLSRETRARDASPEEPALVGAPSTELEAAGRARADETRAATALTVRRGGEVVEWEPVDEEEIGISRRQFLNRGVLTGVGFATATFGAASLAFLWPTSTGGFGGAVTVGLTLDEILAEIADKREPYYVPAAKSYVQRYPADAIEAAKKVYPPSVVAGMEQGIVALYQRCVHLGCRVPWCHTSQWFECPCHGSKYNAVGEKKDGPAPRGLDRWPVTIDGGTVTINTTGTAVQGPPIGTNTTKQQQEGPSCI
jgi:cytochrome b6-f complex iron-sulfur subunit